MSQAKVGVCGIFVFLFFVGCILLVYINENRTLRKQVDMLTVSLQEVVDKYHDLETDHSDCLTRVSLRLGYTGYSEEGQPVYRDHCRPTLCHINETCL